jgi:transcriptional regulator with XRE-family HTH domain/tetratricopeptide (TPR) repeat protein
MAREPEAIVELRRALGERLATFRRAAELTQGQLADATICDRTNVVHIEKGRNRGDERFWGIADEVCKADGALLAGFHELEAAKAEHEHVIRIRELDDVRARAIQLRQVKGELVHVIQKPVAHESHDLAAEAEQLRHDLHGVLIEGALSTASLDEWELTITRHGMATRDRPAGVLLADLSADFAELKQAMSRCRSVSTLRRLTRVAAHMSGLMCLTLVKLNERSAFRGWARTARTAAREADDAAMYSWVLAQEGYGHFYGDDLPEAVHVARHAQAVASKAAGVGPVLAAALEARALAGLGRADETHAALRRAECLLDGLDDQALVPSAFGYNEAQLRFHESNALTHLGNSKAAWVAQDRALELVPPSDFMDRAFTQLDRAACLASDGDISSATTYLLETLLGLTETQRKGIILLRARQLVDALPTQHQAVGPVQELQDLLALPANTEG